MCIMCDTCFLCIVEMILRMYHQRLIQISPGKPRQKATAVFIHFNERLTRATKVLRVITERRVILEKET